MKIIWLCNYSLKYFKERLKLDIDFAGKHPVPWLYYLVSELAKRKEIELHIITMNSELHKDFHFIEERVHYHLIRERSFFVPNYKDGRIVKKKIYGSNILWKNKVIRLINSIDPELINIHGTEGALQVLGNEVNYPSVVWMQGLMNLVTKQHEDDKYNFWLENENKILREQKHFITFPGDMESLIKRINMHAQFYNIYHPNPEYAFDMFSLELKENADLVFVGEIVQRKGIEDFIELVSALKSKMEIKAKIIGFTGDKAYLNFIKNRISELGINKNINFIGYVPEHSDVLMEIKKSKLLVLPTYVDTGPRTIAESMTVGTPVLSYNIDGLPEMIANNFNGILVECGNINQLVSATYELLINDKKRKFLKDNAYKTAVIKYSPKKVVDQLIGLYNQVINEHKSILA